MRALRASALILLLSGLLVPACREPTQLTLHLSTDAKCVDVKGTSITVGAHGKLEDKDPVARTTECSAATGQVGTLVVVPSGSKDDQVSVRVVTGVGKSAEACVKDGYVGGCIVARRTLRFLPHTSLDLPIAMSVDCLDVPCEATQTCLEGKCVSAATQCTGAGDCKLSSPPGDGGTIDTGTGGAAGSGGSAGSGGTSGSGGAGGTGGAGASGGTGGADASADADAASDASDAGSDVSVTCTGTMGECDGNPTQPCETDLSTSATHCGKCGHDCLGGTCVAGACQPVTLFSNAINGPSRLALDATHIYFVDYKGGTVRRMLKDGTAQQVLATGTECNRIAVDGTHVYWTEQTPKLVRRAPKGGGAPETLGTGLSSALGLALDATNAYFSDMSATGAVNRAPKAPGSVQALASNVPWPLEIAITPAHAYWTTFANNGAVRRVPLAGGATEVVVPNVDNSFGIASDAANVYFTVLGTGANKGQVQSVALAATLPATPVVLAVSQGGPRGLAVDATHLFWTNSDTQSVMRIAKDGSDLQKPTLIATGGIEPLGIAVDDLAVYWADEKAGTLRRVAK
ncbi:MAG: hypothetical protein IT375_31515 [Polyangiaceae bacterium]|nr:hypothetical protein [Polyangiaceae bacterium]